MGKTWHSASATKRLAAGLLALALAGIAITLLANQKWVAIQGPGALQPVGPDALWLGVDDELWVLDSLGHRSARHTVQELGLGAAVSNIVPAPNGQALLTSRTDADWQVVDRATLAHVRSIRPQWPSDLASHPLSAIHLAVSPDGDIAVATGGGHAVLLFDRDGRFLARTEAGLYRFTNGLWWSPEGWWTTDTNRFALHLLDASSLKVKQTVQLRRSPVDYPYLGEAVASKGDPQPGTILPPLATVSRLGYLMTPGHVVDVFPDGTQAVYNAEPMLQVRDLAWFDRELLVVDGDAFQVRRFDTARNAIEPFGDVQVRAAFAQLRSDRLFWKTLASRYALLLSVVLLALGLALYARHRRLLTLATLAARESGQEPVPSLPLAQLARLRARLYGVPIAVRLVVLGISLFIVFPLLHWWLLGPRPEPLLHSLELLLATVTLPMVVVALWQRWRHGRLAGLPEFEPALNHLAVQWLRAHDDFDRVKLESEAARETVYLPGWRPRWLVVTNRRVLLFVASAQARRLASEWPRRSVVFAGSPEPTSAWERLFRPANLVLSFTTGTTLHLRCASSATARRVAQLLMSSPAIPEEGESLLVPLPPQRRWHEVLASFVVPGTGQWLQGRFASGTVLFTAALALCIWGWAPVAWALHGPKMDVSVASIVFAVLAWLLISLLASSDAWRFSATRR